MWGCIQAPERELRADIGAEHVSIEHVLDEAVRRIAARADSVDEALRPIPLLRPAQEAALRQYRNAQHLARARSLGVRPPEGTVDLERLQREGELVRLEDSTAYWVVRELDHSIPLVTPDVRALLVELGERFHDELEDLGVPAFRMEVSSALRTAESQAELRQTNRNAARGTSAHEFGTTVDIAYSGFMAPADVAVEHAGPPWLTAHLEAFSAALLERVAARRSRELQAILGGVLREMQAEEKVMVTLEQQQPVYHLTVARGF